MNIKTKVGKRIKEIRKARGLSQEKLSEMIDVAQTTLSCIETGDNFFTADTLEKLVDALDIEPQELFIFDHQKDNQILITEINKMIYERPNKIPQIYKIVKAIYND